MTNPFLVQRGKLKRTHFISFFLFFIFLWLWVQVLYELVSASSVCWSALQKCFLWVRTLLGFIHGSGCGVVIHLLSMFVSLFGKTGVLKSAETLKIEFNLKYRQYRWGNSFYKEYFLNYAREQIDSKQCSIVLSYYTYDLDVYPAFTFSDILDHKPSNFFSLKKSFNRFWLFL